MPSRQSRRTIGLEQQIEVFGDGTPVLPGDAVNRLEVFVSRLRQRLGS
jgi:hypothetical protein